MTFTTSRSALQRLAKGVAASLMAAAVLAGCGGGDQVVPFEPNRVIAFGDENSVIGTTAGGKYTINYADATVAVDCFKNPIWIQVLAADYGKSFTTCPGTLAAANATSQTLAANGAKVADLAAQISTFQASGSFVSNDLVTIWVGQNDILEQYALYTGATSKAALNTELTARGTALGNQVNALTATGAKVLVALAPELSLTPFALAEKAAHTDTDRQLLLSDLKKTFNTALRVTIINDGRLIGLLVPDQLTSYITNNPGDYDVSNITVGACLDASQPPACTALTLVTGATSFNYLWADTIHYSPQGHQRLGDSAHDRAKGNPF
ncbi:MAG: Esterase, hydrolase-type domain protein [Rhizobacter sp.]|nr:Esterase, hydrolase-type domain protein [Rhizobacter sp.]